MKGTSFYQYFAQTQKTTSRVMYCKFLYKTAKLSIIVVKALLQYSTLQGYIQ